MSASKPFRYGLNTSTIRGQKLPLTEVVEIAAKAGYDAIEPWIDELDAHVAEGKSLSDLGKRIADLGLTVEGAIGFFAWIVDDPEQRKEGFVEARRNMALLHQIGGRHIAAPAFGATETRSIDLLEAAVRYRELLEIGDEYGIVPQVEVWGFSQTLQRLGEATLVAIESGHPRACILPDVYHLYKGGSGYGGLRLLRGIGMPVFHVNDVPDGFTPERVTDADRVYPGDGVLPLRDIFRTLKEIGFDGVLSLELFNPSYYAQDALTVARTGLEKLRAVVGQ